MRRLSSTRCYMPEITRLSAREISSVWQNRLHSESHNFPLWLYLHVPYCPQSCKYCQCCRTELDGGKIPNQYLDYLQDEIRFFAPLFKDFKIQNHYIGGGSPNLLNDNQLQRILELLKQNFTFVPNARKTFEFLASIFRHETFDLLRKYGYNRLSCGIQSHNTDTLKEEKRSTRNLDKMSEIIDYAFKIGFDEFNLDLMWGLSKDNEETFKESLFKTLSLNPTTVSVHLIIPTDDNKVFNGLEDEITTTESFLQLKNRLETKTGQLFPEYKWIYRPNIWILVKKNFLNSPNFAPYYYSDNERIHQHIIGFGQFAYSHAIGEYNISNNNQNLAFSPEAKDYNTYHTGNSYEAALDLMTDLCSDGFSDMSQIEKRYPGESLIPLGNILKELEHNGTLTIKDKKCFYNTINDSVFIDDIWPLIERTQAFSKQRNISDKKDFAQKLPGFIKVSDGKKNIMITIEKKSANRHYYKEFNDLGLLYANNQHLTDEDCNKILAPIITMVEKLISDNQNDSITELLEKLIKLAPPV